MTRPHSQAMAAARFLENAAYRIAEAQEQARYRIAQADGWSGGSDAPRVTASSDSTPVERPAVLRKQLREFADQIEDDLRSIASFTASIMDMCNRINGGRSDVERPKPALCDCTSREGSELPWEPGMSLAEGNGWADPTCREMASRGTLCDSCSAREYRWRKFKGLKPRKDGAYSQPGPRDVTSENAA